MCTGTSCEHKTMPYTQYNYLVIKRDHFMSRGQLTCVHKKLLKLLLLPIVHVYTRKCAANIVEKHEYSLVVRFVCVNKVYSLNKSVTT